MDTLAGWLGRMVGLFVAFFRDLVPDAGPPRDMEHAQDDDVLDTAYDDDDMDATGL